MSIRRLAVPAALLALLGTALTSGVVSADGQGTAIQMGGACSDVSVRADGLEPADSVLLTVNAAGQRGFTEVPSSRRVVNTSGAAVWRVPGHALPEGQDCSRTSQFTFSVFLVRADAKLGAKVAGPIDLQRGPSPSIVGHGVVADGFEGGSDGTAARVLLLLGVIGGAVAIRAGVVRATPRSRR